MEERRAARKEEVEEEGRRPRSGISERARKRQRRRQEEVVSGIQVEGERLGTAIAEGRSSPEECESISSSADEESGGGGGGEGLPPSPPPPTTTQPAAAPQQQQQAAQQPKALNSKQRREVLHAERAAAQRPQNEVREAAAHAAAMRALRMLQTAKPGEALREALKEAETWVEELPALEEEMELQRRSWQGCHHPRQ